MGSNSSKSINETAACVHKNDLDIDSNPDPRSPTPEITRTPLQNKNGSKHNITKNVDLRKTFESGQADEKLIHNNPILSAVIKNHLQSYDPRSPTQEFERTPIVIPSQDKNGTVDKKKLRLQTEDTCARPYLNNDVHDSFNISEDGIKLSSDLIIAKNLCDAFYDISLNETVREIEEPLGSSTTSNNAIEEDLNIVNTEKPTKLLETNFDYTETEIFEDSEEIIQDDECFEKSDFEFKKIPMFKILDDDPRSPTMGIERTPIVVAKTEEDASEGNVEEMSDDTLIKALQSTNVELYQTSDTTDGILVYEDESVANDTPKKAKSVSINGSRTPLSCMKNKADTDHTRSKSASTYEATKEKPPAKHLKHVSHIPRFKALSKRTKTSSSVSLKNISKSSAISGDCENTPPHSHRDRWDKDSSIVL
ncbi:unnamed protein product [Parnassius apollo]|uniref:(apollo) hypothetical protein n=1 Tax=Parnassius apollo TaxID=110799 RepID=A0A8S3WT22_PARAO|nr:unnamed protein product [Parnassius apollo]